VTGESAEQAAPCPGILTVAIGEDIFHVAFAAGQTLLDAAERAELVLPHSCRLGNCGACIVKLTHGSVAMPTDCRGLSKRDHTAGLILACRACGTSPTVTIDYSG
jgi:ferredoxin